jgi:hypothetical protein
VYPHDSDVKSVTFRINESHGRSRMRRLVQAFRIDLKSGRRRYRILTNELITDSIMI